MPGPTSATPPPSVFLRVLDAAAYPECLCLHFLVHSKQREKLLTKQSICSEVDLYDAKLWEVLKLLKTEAKSHTNHPGT